MTTLCPTVLTNNGDRPVLVLTNKPPNATGSRLCFWLEPGAQLVVYAEAEIIDPRDVSVILPPVASPCGS